MAYQKLDLTTLTKNCPLILAGPILRQVSKTSVTVWLALQQNRSLTLTIRDATNTKTVAEGHAQCRQIGEHLFIAVVTATGTFEPETTYLYDVSFAPSTLATAGIYSLKGGIELLCYAPYPLPSFTVPADDYMKLRFLHGSCRKLHARGLDATLGLHYAIQRAIEEKETRPHLLMLTGDQIYADDVPASILRIIMDVSAVLFGTRGKYLEMLPIENEAASVQPYQRLSVARDLCHFTSEPEAMENHLLYFGEYCCMYLMMWSDVFWPLNVNDYPTYKETYGKPARYIDFDLLYREQQRNPCVEAQRAQPSLRRALANIPVYMIMDDHEVADDSFINANWCANVLGSIIGRQVVQNALKAYALFQSWGNTPEQFTDPNGPGGKLLSLIEAGAEKTRIGSPESKVIDQCLAIPPVERIFDDSATNKKFWGKTAPDVATHDLSSLMANHVTYDGDGIVLYKYGDVPSTGPVCLRWDFVINGGNYQFVVNDTRTWRAYPGNDLSPRAKRHGDFPCVPISREGLRRQIIEGAALSQTVSGDFVTFVVNGLAPFDVPTLEWARRRSVAALAAARKTKHSRKVIEYDIEGWSSHPAALERFLALWATRELDKLSTTRRRIVMLSGDIHHSYTTKIRYYAKSPMDYKGDPIEPARECAAVFACFTASGFKKQDSKTEKLHHFGYDVFEKLNKRDILHHFGWARKPPAPVELGELTARLVVGREHTARPRYTPLTAQIKGKHMYPNVVCLEELCREEQLDLYLFPQYLLTLPAGNEVSDWRYHLQYLTGKSREEVKVTPLPAGAQAIAAACREFRKCVLSYAPATGPGSQIVGFNNFGDISFGTSGTTTYVVQGNWWNRADGGRIVLADHTYFVVPYDPVRFNVMKP